MPRSTTSDLDLHCPSGSSVWGLRTQRVKHSGRTIGLRISCANPMLSKTSRPVVYWFFSYALPGDTEARSDSLFDFDGPCTTEQCHTGERLINCVTIYTMVLIFLIVFVNGSADKRIKSVYHKWCITKHWLKWERSQQAFVPTNIEDQPRNIQCPAKRLIRLHGYSSLEAFFRFFLLAVIFSSFPQGILFTAHAHYVICKVAHYSWQQLYLPWACAVWAEFSLRFIQKIISFENSPLYPSLKNWLLHWFFIVAKNISLMHTDLWK